MKHLNLKAVLMDRNMAVQVIHMMMAMTTHMRQQVSTTMTMTMTMTMLMSMVRTASMTTELLQLIWLASPALPVGGFSYSEALEAAIDHEHVHDESSCAAWLADQLHLSQARGDMALMAQAIPAWQSLNVARLKELSTWVHATRETHEMRLQTEQMGRSLLDLLRIQNKATAQALQLCSELRPTYPIAMSLALSLANAPLESALQAYAFGWAENMTQAALKAVPLGQISGQKILARLTQEIPEAVQHAIALSDHDRQAFCPMLAVMSARHETQYSRLFRS
jgi:urease accessory protein